MRTICFFSTALLLISTNILADEEAEKPVPFREKLARAALERTKLNILYDPAYVVLDYPGGDVPADRGVCTDVIVRCYRAFGIDLQKLVHEDMKAAFHQYPQRWGLKGLDKNIDHRRVPNLQTFFTRHGKSLAKSDDPTDYAVGDIVAWDLNDKGLLHIGIVVEPADKPGERWIVHNIGVGPQLEDVLFSWSIIGHYRYAPANE